MAKPLRKINTILGVPRFLQLLPPPAKGTYQYFNGANEYPFIPDANQHSPQNAWWLADFSLLSYCNQDEVNQVLTNLYPNQKINLTWLDSPKSNTQGFVLETPEYFIVVFRGTEFPPPKNIWKSPAEIRDIVEDIIIDIAKVKPQTITTGDPLFDVPVHPGFTAALQSVWPTLQAAINKSNKKPIWLTGHSLGAAIATLLAFHIPNRVAGLYTYGSPCAGTSAFVKAFNETGDLTKKTYRYLHGTDAIANGLLLLGMDYQHIGQLIHLDAGSRRGLFAQLANLAIVRTVKLNQLDHAPIIYSYECWNAINE